MSLLIRCVVTERCVDRQSAQRQLPQRQRLGGVHRRCGAVAQHEPGWRGLHAMGRLRPEERGSYKPGQCPCSFDVKCGTSYCIYACFLFLAEAPSCPADGASFSALSSSRIFWVRPFFKGQWAPQEIWEVSGGLEGTLSGSDISCRSQISFFFFLC